MFFFASILWKILRMRYIISYIFLFRIVFGRVNSIKLRGKQHWKEARNKYHYTYITTKPLCENMMVHLTDFISSFIVFNIRKAHVKNRSSILRHLEELFSGVIYREKERENARIYHGEISWFLLKAIPHFCR